MCLKSQCPLLPFVNSTRHYSNHLNQYYSLYVGKIKRKYNCKIKQTDYTTVVNVFDATCENRNFNLEPDV